MILTAIPVASQCVEGTGVDVDKVRGQYQTGSRHSCRPVILFHQHPMEGQQHSEQRSLCMR